MPGCVRRMGWQRVISHAVRRTCAANREREGRVTRQGDECMMTGVKREREREPSLGLTGFSQVLVPSTTAFAFEQPA